ncbi:MAG TPA: hypothetical protein VHS28_05235, partial [Chloroflexota bacterium]|nr:hypothetical protein [Chloroflexota bacterium]
KQVRALARAFSQAEKLVLWLPNPKSGQGEQMCLANVIITPGRNWAYRRPGVTEATSPHFTVIDTTEPVPGSSWILEQTATRGYREGDVPLGIQGFFKTERLAVGRVPAFFVDEWDPLPGKGLPSGLAAKSYRLRRFSLTWVEQGTQVSVHYGDENTTPGDARKRVLKLAAALHAVDASDALAKELRELLRSCGAPR